MMKSEITVETSNITAPTAYIIVRVENPAPNILRIATETLPFSHDPDGFASGAFSALADFVREVVAHCSTTTNPEAETNACENPDT